jgi:hypothetical protein
MLFFPLSFTTANGVYGSALRGQSLLLVGSFSTSFSSYRYMNGMFFGNFDIESSKDRIDPALLLSI